MERLSYWVWMCCQWMIRGTWSRFYYLCWVQQRYLAAQVAYADTCSCHDDREGVGQWVRGHNGCDRDAAIGNETGILLLHTKKQSVRAINKGLNGNLR